MAMQLRPRTLAGGFGAFFLVMAFGTWYFTSSLTTPWYGPDLSRWVYMAYLVAGTVLLAASGAVAVMRSQFLDRRIIELNEQIEALGGVGSLSLGGDDALPPPLPEEPVRDHVDRDIDDLLESLSEMETTAVQVAESGEPDAPLGSPAAVAEASPAVAASRDLITKRERARRMRNAVPRYLAGPAIGGILVMAVAGAMLPGSDGMLQSYYNLNTALILGIGYSWAGLGAYFAATVYALLKQR